MDTLCFGLIGSGGSFCIAENRSKAKHAKAKNIVSPRKAYVLKTPTVAFESPFVQFSLVDPKLQKSWLYAYHTLVEWTELFDASRATKKENSGSPGLSDDEKLKAHQAEKQLKLKYKTPSKRQKLSTDQVTQDMLMPVTGSHVMDQMLGDKKAIDQPTLLHILKALKNQIQVMAKAVSNVKASLEQDAELTHHFSQVVEEKFGHLFKILGQRPKLVPEEFDAPSLWSVLGNIADNCEHSSSSGQLESLIKKYENLALTSELELDSFRAELTFFSNQYKSQANQYQNVNTQVLKMQHQKISHLEAIVD